MKIQFSDLYECLIGNLREWLEIMGHFKCILGRTVMCNYIHFSLKIPCLLQSKFHLVDIC